MPPPIPITIVTGFLGSGKTTLILNLVPQLRAANPGYKLALLKNEFGDVAIDSQLASSGAVSGVQELLNGCICCNLVGQLGDALEELTTGPTSGGSAPDRIVIETSGSAFPATLAMEVNRLARQTGGRYTLDGVVSVIDVENWKGYDDTSYTARVQAKYTDLVVFNKWEACDERRFDECLDRLGDLEVDVAWVKSNKGSVPLDLIFGIDGGLASELTEPEHAAAAESTTHSHDGHGHGHAHGHDHGHQAEVEVLSVTLKQNTTTTSSPEDDSKISPAVDADKLLFLLRTAPKDEVYRIKAVLTASSTVRGSDEDDTSPTPPHPQSRYILNWAFGRWTFTPVAEGPPEHESTADAAAASVTPLRMTVILARYEGAKWKRKLEGGGLLELVGGEEGTGELTVTKVI